MSTTTTIHWRWSVMIFCLVAFAGQAQQNTPSNNVRDVENRVKSPVTAPGQTTPMKQAIAPPAQRTIPQNQSRNRRDDVKFEINDVRIHGDVQFFDNLKPVKKDGQSLRQELIYETVGKFSSLNEIRNICLRYTQVMIDRGYYLAYMIPISEDVSSGVVILEVKTAVNGDARLFHKPDAAASMNPPLYAGKYYTHDQISRRLALPSQEPFNYRCLRDKIFSLNSHPDVNLDTTLRVVNDPATQRQRVDIDYLVSERSPFHGVVQVDNTATQETDDWRARATFQHLNLTERFDILSVDVSSAFNGSYVSAAAGYSIPVPGMDRTTFTAFGGASDLDIDRIVPGIDTDGEGWFGGFQLRKTLHTTDTWNLDLVVDLTHRNTEDQLIDARNNLAIFERDVAATPLTIGLNYADIADDRFKGRNFFNISASTNQSNWLGSDDDTEFQRFRVGAEAEYYVGRLQLVRLQRLQARNGNWLLYFKADGQFSDQPLISSEQKAIGGMNSVRGYHEREVLGDDGVTATLELRSPLIEGNWWRVGKSQRNMVKNFQWLIFSDYGYARRDDRLARELVSENMISLGAGLRMSLLERMQVRFDWGFPLSNTTATNTSSNGRGHLLVQYQF